MTSSSAALALHQPSAQVQADFFSKLARFEHAILSQQHPRYRLPQAEVERLAKALNQASVSSPVLQETPVLTNGDSATAQALPPPQSSPHGSLPQKPSAVAVTDSRGAPPAVEPVTLTKSSDSARAGDNARSITARPSEPHPERIRIEKALQDSVRASKRFAGQDNRDLAPWLGSIRFDAARVLELATSLVKPQSGSKTQASSEDNEAHSSSDEVSYYSSQVNSWTLSPSTKDKGAEATEQALIPSEASKDQLVSVREPRVSGLGPREDSDAIPRVDKLPPSNMRHADATDSSGNSQVFVTDTADVREESYSPPPISYDDSTQPLPSQSLPPDNQAPQFSNEISRARESESYSPPPPPQAPIVANNLQVPIAPQPSRISPIALGNLTQSTPESNRNQKAPPQNQGNSKQDKKKAKKDKVKDAKKSKNSSENVAKKGVLQQNSLSSRKRRRETDNEDDSRRASGQFAARSPSPVTYIKQEPLSPPPLGAMRSSEAPRRLVLRDDGRADIEVMSPRYAGRSTAQRDPHRQANSISRRVEPLQPSQLSNQEPIVIDESDASSPAFRPRTLRREGDLRRVASMQHAVRPISPIAPPYPRYHEEQQHSRPVSRTVVDRPSSRRHQYYDEPGMQAPLIRRFDDRLASPIFVGDEYEPRLQPPPKRRIVVDQWGNEYIAVPARSNMTQGYTREMADYAEPTSPYAREPLRGQSMQVEPRYFQPRQPMRQQAPVIELDDEEEDDYRRMPPPQLVPRKRTVGVRDDRMIPAPPNPSQQGPRAASMQPLPTGNEAMGYQYMPAQLPPFDRGERQPVVRERAYSARPNYAQQEEYHRATSQYRPVSGWQ